MYKFSKEMQNDVIQDWKGQEKQEGLKALNRSPE